MGLSWAGWSGPSSCRAKLNYHYLLRRIGNRKQLSLSLSLSLCGFRMGRNETVPFLVLLLSLSLPWISLAYRPGDLVPMSKMGQYHSVRTLKPSLSLSLSLSLMHIILNFRINLSIFKIFNNFSPELCGTI